MIEENTKKQRRRPWHAKYHDDIPTIYYNLRAEGCTIANCAKKLGVSVKTINDWANDETKPDFMEAHEAGKDVFQSYYEDKLTSFIEKSCTPAQKDLVKFVLATQCREQWAETKSQTIEITDKTKDMDDDKFKEFVSSKLRQLLKLSPELEVVGKDK